MLDMTKVLNLQGQLFLLLAAKYGRNPEFAVGCVATSTLLSLIAIPIWSLFV